jgi:rubrerythrin
MTSRYYELLSVGYALDKHRKKIQCPHCGWTNWTFVIPETCPICSQPLQNKEAKE